MNDSNPETTKPETVKLMIGCAQGKRTSDLRLQTSARSPGRCMRRPRGWRVARSLKSEVGGLENVRVLSPRRLFLTQSRRGAEDADVRLKKRTGKVPAGLISIEDVLSAPMPSPDGSPGLIPIGRSGEDFYFGFSTKYHDREVGLIAYQLRSYSPTLGRWLNRDPIEEEGGVNLYGFVDNGPVFTADSIGSAKFKGKSKTSGFFYSFSVAKCEVVIIYGHGHIRLHHEVTFVDKKTSAAYFWGCWPDVTNSKIPR